MLVVREGRYGAVDLAGVVFGSVVRFRGAVQEGNGTSLHFVDEQATPAQRAALEALFAGGGVGELVVDRPVEPDGADVHLVAVADQTAGDADGRLGLERVMVHRVLPSANGPWRTAAPRGRPPVQQP